MSIQVKQRIALKIKRMGINGEGIGFYQKTLVFVPGALKGEEVYCQVTAVKRNFVEARLLKVNRASKFRVAPACPIYEACGGCQIMHLRYDRQLDFKTDLLRQALKKFQPADFEDYEIRPTIGMKEPKYYRAKLQFQTRLIKGKVHAGLYAEHSHRLIAIQDCLVQDKMTQTVINQVADLLTKHRIPIYDERRNGGIRTVMVRRARETGEIQLIFVTSSQVNLTRLVEELVGEFPEIVTVAVNWNAKKSSEIYGEKTEIIWGQETIEEAVLGYAFALSPRAFYQLNPEQTQILYGEAIKALDIQGHEHLIDAYCGVGTIGFAFAKEVKSLRGMDIIAEAIEDARRNAVALGLDNTYYETGLAEEIIPRWYKEGYRADALVVDPPRTGLDERLLATIVRYQPAKMVYVSCNVSTLARDLVQLAKVYKVDYIQSVDMFPHTARTECVVKLQRKKG
ncbi:MULTISPECIES: 23S rRNA (uracil(1939)-C(5))-methyltransferase RlmD [unclassified Streptococcus]|uniref:23S rRNA (uracil(1939)-C(5))-methyltransferase RlmD n=1 Tax=unclassified Streptococcus TaxID=2608887 RepID=UPI00107206E4|nr:MULTISPECIES: 23S rRNA (uracil(1939)-C(5))-methyltransferase RlmD [unclassified Streptococcus]MBF0787334.1 23S rRNA (uracil(1939)-C(5))-methyltransferase RlmD [Streptococcus sp. 19428wC2_LYSM12]MCQ9211127.1 23S rRNA (uracil(1939)-C(5))-methyltransferase RlmD [Streptococcus sp. B01]MCQ9214402.1 23S rRNA (uracil(1939)-C(5))-methyltransferase RlmD [Streptococcus sp. O1]TFV05682.1 23S rRNA (uracil(1939)-C(5))-methyltransferase RlmD [Streptococcus sp. LYSM12]